MASFKTLDDLGDVTGKVALVRVDLNLPMKDGSATDVTRVEAAKPTILELSDKARKCSCSLISGGPAAIAARCCPPAWLWAMLKMCWAKS